MTRWVPPNTTQQPRIQACRLCRLLFHVRQCWIHQICTHSQVSIPPLPKSLSVFCLLVENLPKCWSDGLQFERPSQVTPVKQGAPVRLAVRPILLLLSSQIKSYRVSNLAAFHQHCLRFINTVGAGTRNASREPRICNAINQHCHV